MVDTIYYKFDLLVNGQERINDLCPIVVEQTTKACGQNAVPLAWIICGTIVIVSIVAALSIREWHIRKNKFAELDELKKENEKLKQENDRTKISQTEYTGKLAAFLEELSKNDKNARLQDIDSPACQKYIHLLVHLSKKGSMDDYQATSSCGEVKENPKQ